MIVTEELIESFRTKQGGFTQRTVNLLADVALRRHGWRENSIGKDLSIESISKIRTDIARRDRKVAAHKKEAKKEKPPKKVSIAKVSQKPVRKIITKPIPWFEGDVNNPSFLVSYEWRLVRMQVLKRDGAKCRCCGASPKNGAIMHVDHIKPRRTHPQLALDKNNLQVLCHECNHGKGNWDSTDWRK